MVSVLKARGKMRRLVCVGEILVEQSGIDKFDKQKHGDGSQKADLQINCACWLTCARGHCVHSYVAVPEVRRDLNKSVPGAGRGLLF